MEFLRFLLKVLLIVAMTGIMVAPFLVELWRFSRDKKKGISFKRLRIVIYAVVYTAVITLLLYVFKELILWIQDWSVVKWIAKRVSVNDRLAYCIKVFAVIIINAAIGFVFNFLESFVRIGLRKKDLLNPKKKDGTFNLRQKAERFLIRFFHTETWFYVGRILKWFDIIISAAYAVVFVLYQIPAMFGADWIPYNFISMLFSAGYVYPVITLLVLWEAYFFLAGISRLEEECPELIREDKEEAVEKKADLVAIDNATKKQFGDFFARDLEKVERFEDQDVGEHGAFASLIGKAVEADMRNPQKQKEIYLDCTEKLVEGEKSLLINGNFFSEFSMYFLRYLSIIVARGDNVVFVCNNDAQIGQVYEYVKQGLSEISSLYCKDFEDGSVDFDDPIWRIVKISGERDVIEEASVDDHSILITTLSYLCSTHFESEHKKFIHLMDTVVFVDTLNTVNQYSRQMSILNTRMTHIAKVNAMLSKNGNVNRGFKVRYMSKQIRYICFDDTRAPGLDKVLKNMLSVELESVDSMNYNAATMIRCYKYEGAVDENGRCRIPQFVNTRENAGVMMNMAIYALSKGAGSVTVFADNLIPYANYMETVAANSGQIILKSVDTEKIVLNRSSYNPDDYSVIIAMDTSDSLPVTLRKYASMTGDKPVLVIVFSRPYLFRDYYLDSLEINWSNDQMLRIPVEEGTRRDIAQKILIKANAGGITEEEILNLCANVPAFAEYAQAKNVNAILRAILETYGFAQVERIDLYKYFEYSSVKDFDEVGNYTSQDRVLLRRQGRLFDMISGRDMIRMIVGDVETILPIPQSRLTQYYITGQNFLYEGNIYRVDRVEAAEGKLFAHLTSSGDNNDAYQYVNKIEYRIEYSDEMSYVAPVKHFVVNGKQDGVEVSDAYISVYRAPMEAVTHGYYKVDPYTMRVNFEMPRYVAIDDEGQDIYARQTYRRYGNFSEANRYYSSDKLLSGGDKAQGSEGAQIMSVKLCGSFGADKDKVLSLAAAMLSEILSSMFPSVAKALAVCPVLSKELSDEEAKKVLCYQPKVTFFGNAPVSDNNTLELLIIEDCAEELGVISVLANAGHDLLATLFSPIYRYLSWYNAAENKSDYLYCGLGHEPSCYDFAGLTSLATLLGDDKIDHEYAENEEAVTEYDTCDFCGRKYEKGSGDITELEDGRRMCRECAESIVGNNKKVLKAHLDRARIYLESTYGIVLDDDYEFCFESTVKIANTLKQNRALTSRGTDIGAKAYVDDKKKVHVEYDIPAANLSELLVRELTYTWQLRHIPDVAEHLCEGHIALVAVQYLRFLNQNDLAAKRTSYYESTDAPSGVGYRDLVRDLLEKPQFRNNPFTYLLSLAGGDGGYEEREETRRDPQSFEIGELGRSYTASAPDRILDGPVPYIHYSRLPASLKSAYDIMVEAIKEHRAGCMVNISTKEEVTTLVRAIHYDHPELFWFVTVAYDPANCGDMTFKYGATAEEAEVLNRRIEEVIPHYLEGIDDSMSAYDVALRLHVRVINCVDYDTVALRREEAMGGPDMEKIDPLRTICGVFLDGKAVCEGYARAMQFLLQRCGIECAECAGYIRKDTGENGGGHAWNILKIDGDYYYLDTTWDDSSNTIQTVKQTGYGVDYFCITTDELCRTRDLSLNPVDMPECVSKKANYYTHNDMVISSYDLEKIKSIAVLAAEKDEKSFCFKCSSRRVYDDVLSKLCSSGQGCYEVLKAAAKKNKKINASSYSYSYNKNLYTITIHFKQK